MFSAPGIAAQQDGQGGNNAFLGGKAGDNAVEMRQSPKPRGLKMGVIRLPTKARRLESGVAATFRRVSNVCRNQITTVATKIIVKAR